jgi:hypothetical protein
LLPEAREAAMLRTDYLVSFKGAGIVIVKQGVNALPAD